MPLSWNPWHGCKKISDGCKNCFIYAQDLKWGIDTEHVSLTKQFDLPLKKGKDKRFKIEKGSDVITCLSSDFFIEQADEWRASAWQLIKQRPDIHFHIITKRINRFFVELPLDWGAGYNNVTILCTIENQKYADYRLPIFLSIPAKHKQIICEPILEKINLEPHLDRRIEKVLVGGESGEQARICNFDWILHLRNTCIKKKVTFCFRQTGSNFQKDGQTYHIPYNQQQKQAQKAQLNIKYR